MFKRNNEELQCNVAYNSMPIKNSSVKNCTKIYLRISRITVCSSTRISLNHRISSFLVVVVEAVSELNYYLFLGLTFPNTIPDCSFLFWTDSHLIPRPMSLGACNSSDGDADVDQLSLMSSIPSSHPNKNVTKCFVRASR